MEIILLEKIENLGALGDKVSVKSGFARNFLIPTGKAKYATKANVEEFEALRAELEKAAAELLTAAQARASKFSDVSVTIEAQAGNEGKLFGSVTNSEVADAISKASGEVVEKRQVRMPDGPLRLLGDYEITIHLHSDVDAVVKVTVVEEA